MRTTPDQQANAHPCERYRCVKTSPPHLPNRAAPEVLCEVKDTEGEIREFRSYKRKASRPEELPGPRPVLVD